MHQTTHATDAPYSIFTVSHNALSYAMNATSSYVRHLRCARTADVLSIQQVEQYCICSKPSKCELQVKLIDRLRLDLDKCSWHKLVI